jgi:hypothetical protein
VLAESTTSTAPTTNTPTQTDSGTAPTIVSNQTGLESVSKSCLDVFQGSVVQATCSKFQTDTSVSLEQAVKNMCTAPADGAEGHFCSEDQINKALDALEKSCKAELTGSIQVIQESYVSWLTYNLNREGFCMTSSSGSYCVVDALSSQNGATECDECTRKRAELMLDWKPPREPIAAEHLIERHTQIDEQTAELCGIELNETNEATSTLTNIKLCIGLVGGLLLSGLSMLV